MYSDMVYMYCEHRGGIFMFLNRSLQESLLLEFVVILIYIFILNILMLDVARPPKLYHNL